MKHIFITFICIFIFLNAKSQIATQDTSSIYLACLKQHLAKVGNLETIIVEGAPEVVSKLLNKVLNIKIEYLTVNEIKKRLKEKKSLYVIHINNIMATFNELKINIVDLGYNLYNNKLNVVNSGGSQFDIVYNCIAQKFEIRKILGGGL